MIISMMGVTSHFSSTSSSPYRRSQDANFRNRRVDEYRSSTISDDVGVRQGYLLGSALNSFGV